RVELRLPGRHNVENFLAAATVAVSLGCSLEEIATAAAGLGAARMRGEILEVGGARVWDDSYNSNPDALGRTLAAAAELEAERRWAVLGEMLELGPGSPAFHLEAGRTAARLGFSPVVGVGEGARDLVTAAREGGVDARWVEDAAAAAEVARGELRSGDLVVVKGSRGVGLEAVVAALAEVG
ncbi:MAG: cyanophycin synthetase, partial [Thermoanaerobaculia bacterium]|nr:cyanophycin synthetase [Thermoanaerobaculia bacterium]